MASERCRRSWAAESTRCQVSSSRSSFQSACARSSAIAGVVRTSLSKRRSRRSRPGMTRRSACSYTTSHSSSSSKRLNTTTVFASTSRRSTSPHAACSASSGSIISATTLVSITIASGGSHLGSSNATTVARRRSYLADTSIPSPSSDGVGAGTEAQALSESGDAGEARFEISRVGDLRSDGAGSELVGEPAARQVVGSSPGHDTRLRRPVGAVYTACM